MKVTYIGSEPAADEIRTFFFRPVKRIRQIAGQYIELTIPHDNMDDRGDKRWFTLSNSPSDELLSITTRLNPHSSSFKKALLNLKPGTELNMASPMGDFVLPKDSSIPLLFVAGGIGSTPYHSIIKFLQDTGEKRDISLLYAANNVGNVAFRETFEKLGDKFKTQIGNRISAEEILKNVHKSGTHVYVSGPEPMVEALEKDLLDKGLDKNHFHGDFFPGYTGI